MTTSAKATGLPERIGRYRVVERIGKGAMGTVYAALDEQLGRRVAIKLMLGVFDEDPELRERFFREARITGQLVHRNIVTTYDLGEDNGRPFIVMELLDGLPLQDYLRTDAPVMLDAKIDLMMQVCDGLQSAHAAGVVHRDIKPSNLMILRDGTLKVLDFGVARLASSTLTAHGMLLGTPEYMSPEQARGVAMGAPADVFAAAGVFYFMLAGRPPFGSKDLQKVLHGIIHDAPPPLPDDVAPEPLWRVLSKGLAKATEERYQQCADMRADLEQVRRSLAATTSRTIQAARDRYRQILTLIEERRAIGQSLAVADIDASCDEARERLETRFHALASDESLIHPMDRAVATAALEALQLRHNAEQAALAALRDRAAAALQPPAGDGARDRSRGGFWRDLLGPREN